ncbi:hypothetical protein [Allosphingosinicella vermicomposti]|uniref:hypothetical protein n=1 Tax=Allosphingosinicella vermicomposti TaxID=614671 RepID=UPI000D112E34|nr:hypothetical protein [Allosphingosinicella vermicomposti]
MNAATQICFRAVEPLPLHHSWPLFERERRFDLGRLLDWPGAAFPATASPLANEEELARLGIGRWECDLDGDRLTWSAGVYDLFGLPRGAPVRRDETVALYIEESRSGMERLRAYAIRHQRGFTFDAQIRPASGGDARWMRLIAAPVCEGGRVTRLHGLKQRL